MKYVRSMTAAVLSTADRESRELRRELVRERAQRAALEQKFDDVDARLKDIEAKQPKG